MRIVVWTVEKRQRVGELSILYLGVDTEKAIGIGARTKIDSTYVSYTDLIPFSLSPM